MLLRSGDRPEAGKCLGLLSLGHPRATRCGAVRASYHNRWGRQTRNSLSSNFICKCLEVRCFLREIGCRAHPPARCRVAQKLGPTSKKTLPREDLQDYGNIARVTINDVPRVSSPRRAVGAMVHSSGYRGGGLTQSWPCHP